jgi:DNA-directed RNA polymerase subunit RPC12/RpoP
MKANNFLRKQSKQEIAPPPGTDISEKRKMEEAIAGDDQGHVCSLCFNSITSHSKSRFIECKKCTRWFHGYCVILTNQEIEAMDPKEEWHCPGCYGSRKLIARLEKEPKAGQQLPGVEVAEEPPKKDKKHRGRPTKPFFERADYKLAERKEIMKRLGRAEHPELFDVLNEEERENSDQSDSSNDRIMPYDEMGEEIFSEDKTSCPVCQYPDLGRPLYTCINCSRQFHKECLGIILDVRHLMSSDFL